MDANPGVMVEHAGTRSSSRAVLRQPAGPWQVFLLTGLAWLLISVIVLRFTLTSAAAAGALVGVAVVLCASGESPIASANCGLPPRSRLAGYALAAVLAPVLTLLAGLRGRLSLTTDALTFLVAVNAVELAGGLAPSVLESIAGSLLAGFYLISPVHNSAITEDSNLAALGVFAAVALMVSILVGNAVRHGEQAARAIAESELLAAAAAEAARPIAHADRMRTALLAVVSHDLRTPLAAPKAAVSCLRSGDIELTAADQDELLAAADESLDLLTNLVASLLDVSRLQAGALPVFPRPADLQEIIARSLGGIRSQAEAGRHAGTGADSWRRPDHGHFGARRTRAARACPGSPGSRERERTGIDPTPSRDHDGAPAWHGAGVTVSRSPTIRRSRALYPPCWPVVECHSDSPGHAARAAGSDVGALQTWFRPLGRPKPGVSRGTD